MNPTQETKTEATSQKADRLKILQWESAQAAGTQTTTVPALPAPPAIVRCN